jgi:hypothetical protein
MMHQDDYPAYFECYHLLCKEKIAFPARDANIRMLMGNFCQDSPMFEHVESMAGREIKPTTFAPKPKPALVA